MWTFRAQIGKTADVPVAYRNPILTGLDVPFGSTGAITLGTDAP